MRNKETDNMLLKKLSPAEVMLVRYPGSSSNRKMIKNTLMDLLMKGVLERENEAYESTAGDPLVHVHIFKGKNYDDYQAEGVKPHERIYLDALPSRDSKLLLKLYVRFVYDNAATAFIGNKPLWKFKKLVKQSPDIKNCFSDSRWNRFWGKNELNKNGNLLQASLNKEIKETQKKLISLKQDNPEEARHLVMEMGGNMVLIEKAGLTLSKEIKDLFKEKEEQIHEDYITTTHHLFWSSIFLNEMRPGMNGFESMFDSVYDSADGYASDGGFGRETTGEGGAYY